MVAIFVKLLYALVKYLLYKLANSEEKYKIPHFSSHIMQLRNSFFQIDKM